MNRFSRGRDPFENFERDFNRTAKGVVGIALIGSILAFIGHLALLGGIGYAVYLVILKLSS